MSPGRRRDRPTKICGDFPPKTNWLTFFTYLGHLLVGGEVLLVLRVLEVVLLDVGPELLDALGAGSLLLANDVGQLGAELHGLGQTGSLRHGGGGVCELGWRSEK